MEQSFLQDGTPETWWSRSFTIASDEYINRDKTVETPTLVTFTVGSYSHSEERTVPITIPRGYVYVNFRYNPDAEPIRVEVLLAPEVL